MGVYCTIQTVYFGCEVMFMDIDSLADRYMCNKIKTTVFVVIRDLCISVSIAI